MTGVSVRGPDFKYLRKYDVTAMWKVKTSKFADSTQLASTANNEGMYSQKSETEQRKSLSCQVRVALIKMEF